jgi:hypothetical protein
VQAVVSDRDGHLAPVALIEGVEEGFDGFWSQLHMLSLDPLSGPIESAIMLA